MILAMSNKWVTRALQGYLSTLNGLLQYVRMQYSLQAKADNILIHSLGNPYTVRQLFE